MHPLCFKWAIVALQRIHVMSGPPKILFYILFHNGTFLFNCERIPGPVK